MAGQNPFDQFDAQAGGVILLDPYKAASEARAERADARAERSDERATDAASRAASNQAEQNRIANERLKLDQQRFAASQAPNQKAQAEKTARIARLRALDEQLNRVRQLYGDNLRGGAPNQLNTIVPDILNPRLGQFDSAAAGLSEQALGAFRVPGIGSQSDAELRAFINANQPKSTDSDLRIEEKLGNIRRRIEAELGNLEPQARDNAAAIATPQGLEIDEAGSRPLLSPQDRDFLSKNARNLGADGIRQYFAARGLQVPDSQIQAAVDYYAKGGRQDAVINAPQGEGNWLGPIAANPVGAYGIGAANAMTLGALDEIIGATGGDRNAAQAAKDLASQQNPTASLLGNVTGGALALAAPEAALSRLGVGGATGVLAPRLAATDALYGAAYGAGENNDDRLSGALTGGITGALGGVAGRGATSGLGMAFRGVRDAGVRRLQNAGIPMTLGQLASQSGRVGAAVKGVEDRLAGLPVVGDLVNARRREGLEAFNRAAFNEALAPIQGAVDQVAEGGIQQAQNAVSQAYDDALRGVNISPDPMFVRDMTAVRNNALAIPNHGPALGHTLDNDLGSLFGTNGNLSGENLQAALQTLRQEIPAYKGAPLGSAASGALRDAEEAITGLVGRQSPDTMSALGNANQAYRNLSILQDVVGDSAKNTDGIFTPAQLNMKSAQNRRMFGGKAANARGDRPFFELGRAAQDILPSKVPDSGTAGRLALPAVLGGAGLGAGYLGGDTEKGAAIGLIAAAPATRLGQRLIENALTRRSPEMVRVGDMIVNRSQLGGMTGATSLPYLVVSDN